MLRTNLQARFGIVEDVRVVSDPWGAGITFHLSRAGRKKYQAAQREKNKLNPLTRATQRAMARVALKTMTTKPGDIVEGGSEALTARALEEAFVEIERDPGALDTMFASDQDGAAEVAALIEDWHGVTDAETGEPVPFSPEAAIELLSSEEWIEGDVVAPSAGPGLAPTVLAKGLPYGGRTLGQALQAFLREESFGHELARRKFLGDAGKASAPSSGGVGATGSDSPS